METITNSIHHLDGNDCDGSFLKYKEENQNQHQGHAFFEVSWIHYDNSSYPYHDPNQEKYQIDENDSLHAFLHNLS